MNKRNSYLIIQTPNLVRITVKLVSKMLILMTETVKLTSETPNLMRITVKLVIKTANLTTQTVMITSQTLNVAIKIVKLTVKTPWKRVIAVKMPIFSVFPRFQAQKRRMVALPGCGIGRAALLRSPNIRATRQRRPTKSRRRRTCRVQIGCSSGRKSAHSSPAGKLEPTHVGCCFAAPDDGDSSRPAQVFVPATDYDRAFKLFYTEREDEL